MSKPVVFITGTSTGIGAGLVKSFAESGYRVACCARREEVLTKTAKPLLDKGYDIKTYVVDVRKKKQIHAAIEDCISHFGQLDCVVANAGISLPSHVERYHSQIFDKTFNTNVLGVVNTFEKAIPYFIERKQGQLVSIGSLASFRGLPGAGAYCSSKAALATLTESLRIDLRKYNVDVTHINPGFIKSPLTDQNNYKMPLIMPTEKGVNKIMKAILKRKKVYSFPWQLSIPLTLSRLLPLWLYDAIISRVRNDKTVTITD